MSACHRCSLCVRDSVAPAGKPRPARRSPRSRRGLARRLARVAAPRRWARSVSPSGQGWHLTVDRACTPRHSVAAELEPNGAVPRETRTAASRLEWRYKHYGHKEGEEGSEEVGGEESQEAGEESSGPQAGKESGTEEEERREAQAERSVHEGDDPHRHPGSSRRREGHPPH